MEQTIKWVKGDRPEKEGWYLVWGTVPGYVDGISIDDEDDVPMRFTEVRYSNIGTFAKSRMTIEYHAEIIGPNGEKYE